MFSNAAYVWSHSVHALKYCPLNIYSHISSLQSSVKIIEYLNVNFKPVSCFQDGMILVVVKHLSVFLVLRKPHTQKDKILSCQICRLILLMYLWCKQIHSNSFALFQIWFSFFPTNNDPSALYICFSSFTNFFIKISFPTNIRQR